MIKEIITYKINTTNSEKIDVEKKEISEIYGRWWDGLKEQPVKEYYSIKGMVDYINGLKQDPPKSSPKGQLFDRENPREGDQTMLTGIYEGGISAQHCIQPSNVVFLDIDLKTEKDDGRSENEWLKDEAKRLKILEALEPYTFSLCNTRTLGIMGIIYVHDLNKYTYEESLIRKDITEEVFKTLEDIVFQRTGFELKLDIAQGKFRQNRVCYHQRDPFLEKHIPAEFRPNPITFTYEKHTEVELIPNTNKKALINHSAAYAGSVLEQYDKSHTCEEILDAYSGVVKERSNKNGEVRFKRIGGGSGGIRVNTIENTAHIYSSGSIFESGRTYRPHGLAMAIEGFTSKGDFIDYLKSTYGYKERDLNEESIISEIQKGATDERLAELQGILKYKSYSYRRGIFNAIKFNENEYKYTVQYYLGIKNLKREPDYTIRLPKILKNGKYQSRKLAGTIFGILGVTVFNKKVIIQADTGLGKTYSFFHYVFKHMYPMVSLCLLVPLQSIAQSACKSFGEREVLRLFGNSKKGDVTSIKWSKLIIATYDRGLQLLDSLTEAFKLLVIDEIHSTSTTMSYRYRTLNELQIKINALEDVRIVGLSGTPLSCSSEMGYFIMKMEPDFKTPLHLVVRRNSFTPYAVVQQIVKNKAKGKRIIIRAASTKDLETAMEDLINSNVIEREKIEVMHSENKKNSGAYQGIMETERIPDEIEVLLVSPLIDEGVSILNEDFDEMHFIQSAINPEPEPVKQFFARFRNPKPDMKCFLYVGSWKRGDEDIKAKNYKEEKERIETALEVISKLMKRRGNNPLGSFSEYLLRDGSLNEWYLGYRVNKSFFRSLSTEEILEYMHENWGVTYEIDISYQAVNSKKKKAPRIHEKTAIKKLKKDWYLVPYYFNHASVLASEKDKSKISELMDKETELYYQDGYREDLIAICQKYDKKILEKLLFFRRVVRIVEANKLKVNPIDLIFKGDKWRSTENAQGFLTFLETQEAHDWDRNSFYGEILEKIREVGSNTLTTEDIKECWPVKVWDESLIENRTKLRTLKTFIHWNTDFNFIYREESMYKEHSWKVDANCLEWLSLIDASRGESIIREKLEKPKEAIIRQFSLKL